MNDNENPELKDTRAANLRIAIILGIVAFIVAIMPFFYLKDMAVPG